MGSPGEVLGSELVERRYLRLVELSRMVSRARDWKELASGISQALEPTLGEPPGVRLWAIIAEGLEEVARWPAQHDFAHCPPRELQRAASSEEMVESGAGSALVGIHAGGVSLGVVEIEHIAVDGDLLSHAAPMIASRVSMLAGQGVEDVLLAPVAVDAASDVASLMAAFAIEAKRQLSHDRLSAYLLTCQGRAFERFAVATSPIIPGEGVVIPFEDMGLRHVVITNRGLVSADLATDPRIVGREDRVIAAAGFHGLLSVPLRRGGRPIGVLNFVSQTPGFYLDQDIPIGQQIADQVAGFIDNLHIQQRMRALIRHEAAERERTRVGRDLYQVVAQNVPSIARIAEELERRVSPSDANAGEQLAEVRDLAQGTLNDVRRAVADLMPRDLDAMTLDEAVRSTLLPLEGVVPVPRLKITGDTTRISAAARRAASRIVQEAVTNVRQHANAKTLMIKIDCERDLVMTIEDDGDGFDPERPATSSGMGLEHMLERARALGGLLTIDSAPGAGTRIRFELLGVADAADDFAAATAEQLGIYAGQARNLRLFIIERHPLMRAGLRHQAESAPDLRVVGTAGTTDEARAQLRGQRPDVALIDGHLPASEVEKLIHELRDELPLMRIIVTFESATGHEASLVEAGASSYLKKTATAAEFAAVVRGTAGGLQTVPTEIPLALEGSMLSPRERSILLLMAAGRTNTEIGQTLFLATKTVERQVATIVHKLGARNRAHAAAIAVARHIVDPDAAG